MESIECVIWDWNVSQLNKRLKLLSHRPPAVETDPATPLIQAIRFVHRIFEKFSLLDFNIIILQTVTEIKSHNSRQVWVTEVPETPDKWCHNCFRVWLDWKWIPSLICAHSPLDRTVLPRLRENIYVEYLKVVISISSVKWMGDPSFQFPNCIYLTRENVFNKLVLILPKSAYFSFILRLLWCSCV